MKKSTKVISGIILSIDAIILSIASIIVLLISVFVVFLIYNYIDDGEYTDNIVNENGYEYNLSNYRKECAFSIDDDYFLEGMDVTIDIPDTYNGYKVTCLGKEYSRKGASLWTGFTSDMPLLDIPEIETDELGHWIRVKKDELPENAEITTYNLTINLGKYVKKVYANFYSEDKYLKVKDENRYIHLRVYVNCPEDNKYFYSVDGVLYNKSDDTPVIKNFFMY